jgi:hypothetical protein
LIRTHSRTLVFPTFMAPFIIASRKSDPASPSLRKSSAHATYTAALSHEVLLSCLLA